MSPGIDAVVRVRLAPGAGRERFETCVQDRPVIRDVWELTGDFDYEVRLACPDLGALNAELHRLRDCGGVQESTTCLLLRFVVGAAPEMPKQMPKQMTKQGARGARRRR